MTPADRTTYSPIDVVAGASAIAAGMVVIVVRRVRPAVRPAVRIVLDPPLVPAVLRPRPWLELLGSHGAVMRRSYQPKAARRLDALVHAAFKEVLNRADPIELAALAEQVVDAIDLSAIVRESTGTMASDTVQGARMQGIAADEAVERASDRLFRRRGRE